MKPDFSVVWQRIVACERQKFHQIRGGEFSYEVHGDSLDLDRTRQSLSRSEVEKAYDRAPLEDTVLLQDLRAPSYLYAILMDERIRRGDW